MKKLILAALCLCAAFLTLSTQIKAADRQQFASMGDYKLENGSVIIDCKVGYRVFGKLNSSKSNGILFPSWYGGTTLSIEQMIKPWKAVDTTKYCLILVDAFGDGVSSSPSNSASQHGADFPSFTIRDMVNSQYKLLTEKFGINHLKAVMGISMGGFQAFQWAVSYPDYMSHIITLVATPQPSSYDLVEWNIMRRIIETDTAFHGGRYKVNPIIATGTLYMLLNSYTPQYVIKTMSRKAANGLMKATETAKVKDWDDTWYQLKALIEHDVAKPYDGSLAEAAKQVKAKCTIMVERQDHLCNPQPATEFSKLLGAKLIVLESDLGHIGVAEFNDPQIKQGIQDELGGAD